MNFRLMSLYNRIYKILRSSKLRHKQLHSIMYSSVEDVRTRQSIEERDYSESNQTYYYSKFQLFDDNEEISQFYQYSLFLQKVSTQLGEQWKEEANILYQPYFNSRDIFMILLSIWLHHHPVVNNINFQKENKFFNSAFHQNYLEDFNNRILQQILSKGIPNSQNFKLKKTQSKAVCMGFFLTANEIWTDMFQKPVKTENKKFNLFSGMTKKIQQSFQPLMVVTEKISNLFGRKKVKKNDDLEVYDEEKNGKMFENCYHEFKRTVDLQKELVRKMSDFSLQEQCQDGSIKEKKKTVSQQEFKAQEAPVQKNALGNFYEYMTKYLKTKYPWRVANSFVTNIMDLNQLETDNGAKIKVMKPASDFYEKLIIVWLTLKKNKEKQDIKFDEFLHNVRCSFSLSWKQKYVVPVRYFYEKIMKNWNQISKETEIIELNDEEKMNILIKKIRQSMKEDWQRKIKIQKKKQLKQNTD